MADRFQITLEAARVNASMTQEQVAQVIGVSKQTIINWEKGRIIPGIPQMEMLSRVYEVPIDRIRLSC